MGSTGVEWLPWRQPFFCRDPDVNRNEGPAHWVVLREPFEMGKYEVTQEQWRAVMADNPSRFKGSDLPVYQVSWDDVQEFLHRLNQPDDGYFYRLPTEFRSRPPGSLGSVALWKAIRNEAWGTPRMWLRDSPRRMLPIGDPEVRVCTQSHPGRRLPPGQGTLRIDGIDSGTQSQFSRTCRLAVGRRTACGPSAQVVFSERKRYPGRLPPVWIQLSPPPQAQIRILCISGQRIHTVLPSIG